jgi:glycosyltransferase involved in cell wall biosynthesis
MKIVYFFRKPSPVFHSIEKLFSAVIENLPVQTTRIHYAQKVSQGILNRISIGLDARRNQGQINHITGDIHYIALFLKRKNTILTIHDIGSIKSGNFIKRKLIRLIWFYLPIRAVRLVTVISEFTKKELLAEMKVNPNKIVVIPNCYPSVYHFEEKKTNPGKPDILQIGTKSNKNLERLIEALSGIECKLLIIGKLTEQQMVLLQNFKIDFENHFNVSESEMVEFYQHSSLLAYVSTYEGFGMPVVEANAVGLPVLASNIEPIISVAADAALLVNPSDINQTRAGILRLLNDGEFCKKLVSNGFDNAKKYHPEKIVNDYLKVYESIMTHK